MVAVVRWLWYTTGRLELLCCARIALIVRALTSAELYSEYGVEPLKPEDEEKLKTDNEWAWKDTSTSQSEDLL